MPVSPESVSSNAPHGAGSAHVLVVAPSWLGDCVMVMPALAAFRKRLPGVHISILAKPTVAALWTLVEGVESVIPLKTGFKGMRETVCAVREGGFDFAYVLPKSFRSAWIPFLARVRGRRGMAGHGRDWMLTETVVLSAEAERGHQSLEMAEVFHIAPGDLESPPFLLVPDAVRTSVKDRYLASGSAARPLIAFFPGAAHGPAKRWPTDRFVALGQRVVADTGCAVLVLGGKGDVAVCAETARGIGPGAMDLAGRTSLPELAGVLAACRCVVANDSGGMHLAAGLGVPVVGLFGMTDPGKTAPVGNRNRLLTAEGVVRSRDIDRDSTEARQALESITVESVHQAVTELM